MSGSGTYQQVTTVHEFAHMIGLDDEYGPLFGGANGPHTGDYGSLLNVGSNVRNRHLNHLLIWLDKKLNEYLKKAGK